MPDATIRSATFSELLGDFGEDYSRLGHCGAIDHSEAAFLEIHPLRHVDMAEGIPSQHGHREIQLESIAPSFASRGADYASACRRVMVLIQATNQPRAVLFFAMLKSNILLEVKDAGLPMSPRFSPKDLGGLA